MPEVKSRISIIDEVLKKFKICQAQTQRYGAILIKHNSPYEVGQYIITN